MAGQLSKSNSIDLDTEERPVERWARDVCIGPDDVPCKMALAVWAAGSSLVPGRLSKRPIHRMLYICFLESPRPSVSCGLYSCTMQIDNTEV